MNIINNILYGWSTYEKLQQTGLILGIFLISLLAIYYISKNKNLLILSTIAFLLASLLNILGILLVNILFRIEITEVFRLVPTLTSILLVSNIGILIGFYVHKRGKKGFDISAIRLEYFSDTVKQTIFQLLLASSVFLFVSVQTQAILVISVLSCLGAVWFIYWISKYLLK